MLVRLAHRCSHIATPPTHSSRTKDPELRRGEARFRGERRPGEGVSDLSRGLRSSDLPPRRHSTDALWRFGGLGQVRDVMIMCCSGKLPHPAVWKPSFSSFSLAASTTALRLPPPLSIRGLLPLSAPLGCGSGPRAVDAHIGGTAGPPPPSTTHRVGGWPRLAALLLTSFAHSGRPTWASTAPLSRVRGPSRPRSAGTGGGGTQQRAMRVLLGPVPP